MTAARANAISLVASLWLLAVIAGVTPTLAIAVGLPCIVVAGCVYVSELKRRYRRHR